jgi:hypothetical protein
VGFYDGDPNRPYVDAVLGGDKTPDASGMTLTIVGNGASITMRQGSISIGAGAVSIGAGVVTVGASKDQYGNGGIVDVVAEGDVNVKGETIFLGLGAIESALLGESFIEYITAITVGGAPIDNVAAVKAQLQAQTLAAKVKVI